MHVCGVRCHPCVGTRNVRKLHNVLSLTLTVQAGSREVYNE